MGGLCDGGDNKDDVNTQPNTRGDDNEQPGQVEQKEEPKQEEPKTEEPKTEEPKQEEPKQEEPKQEEPKTEEPKTEEPQTEPGQVEQKEEPKVEEPKIEEPGQVIKEDDNNESKEETIHDLSGVVTRKEFFSLSDKEQNRFMDAIHKMCENPDGPGSSHFMRIAGYHGQPLPIYCAHGIEIFPGWHRIYLKHFEDHLRLADKQLGNDGNIALHYWDWATNPQLPKILRERWKEWPKDLFPKDFHPGRKLTRATDRTIRRQIRSYDVAKEAHDCLLATQHFTHASTGNEWASNYPSLESPHNSIHGIVGGNGGPMGSVAVASFDVAFWLHHCNVDRIYSKYLELEPDSEEEFKEHQNHENRDLFDEVFTPFDKLYPDKGYRAADTFSTEKLGYNYDKLPPTPQQQLREPPTLVVYPQVRVDTFESRCYQVHTFVIDKDKVDDFKAPTSEDDIDDEKNPNYAGSRVIFGRGVECSNCKTRDPYDMIIDVSKTIKQLGLSRYNTIIKTYVFETNTDEDVYLDASQTPLPQPYITGPLFEDNETNLEQKEKDNLNKNEVMALQRYLKRFGYFEGDVNGTFDEVTEQAVKDYQEAAGMEANGVVGSDTKKAMLSKKRCSNTDGFANNNVKDDRTHNDKVNYKDEKKIQYSVGITPGYLKRNDVLKAISLAYKEWSKYTGIEFEFVEDEEKSEVDIKMGWNKASKEDDNILRFDGPGGVLGHSGKGYVYFDIAERWVIGINLETGEVSNEHSDLGDSKTWYRGSPMISLYYVALHEIGHTLGLDHSKSGKDVMGPYYTPTLVTLQENDIERIKKLYPSEE